MKERNKSLILLLSIVAIVLGSQVILSCCDPLTPPDPPKPPVVEKELSPVIEVTVTPEGIVPYGSSVALRYNNSNTNLFWVDGQKQEPPTEGTFISGPICRKTTFWLMATNVELTTKKYLDIREVGPWYETTFGLVSYYPWRYDSLGVSSLDGEILRRWSVTPEEKDVVYFYLKEGILYSSENPNRTNPWYILDENTIVINGSVQKLQVDDKQMIISYQTEDHGEIVWFDMIFEHASDVPNDPD